MCSAVNPKRLNCNLEKEIMVGRSDGKVALGAVGIWSMELKGAGRPRIQEAAAELESLGYPTLWLPGLDGSGTLDDLGHLLKATSRTRVATGVLNIWSYEAPELATRVSELQTAYGHRALTGLGIGAPAGAAAHGRTYGKPTQSMGEYLDALDLSATPIASGERLLGALGPRMVDLAVQRTAGWHPFLVPPRYVAAERERVGGTSFIAPHQAVVLDADPERARAAARAGIGMFLGFPTYRANLVRLGYGDDDLVPGGSDRIIDDLVAWGDVERVARRVREHLDAGADHVALHVIPSAQDGQKIDGLPLRQWRDLADLGLTVASPSLG